MSFWPLFPQQVGLLVGWDYYCVAHRAEDAQPNPQPNQILRQHPNRSECSQLMMMHTWYLVYNVNIVLPFYYLRPQRSYKLATLAVESFGRLGKEGSDLIDQVAARLLEGRTDRP